MTGDLGPVLISSREIYDAVVRLTGRVDVLIEQRATDREQAAAARASDREDLADHEGRLRSLERGRWPLPALAVLVSIAALALAALAPFQH